MLQPVQDKLHCFFHICVCFWGELAGKAELVAAHGNEDGARVFAIKLLAQGQAGSRGEVVGEGAVLVLRQHFHHAYILLVIFGMGIHEDGALKAGQVLGQFGHELQVEPKLEGIIDWDETGLDLLAVNGMPEMTCNRRKCHPGGAIVPAVGVAVTKNDCVS